MKRTTKVLLSIMVPVILISSLALGLMFGLKKEPNRTVVPQEQVEQQENINIPGVYYATEQEVEESGVAQAPMSEKGGAIYVGAGVTYNMSGGILKNQSAVYGGAVYVAKGGTFTMTGGMILMNQASFGGGIYVESGGTVNLEGGSITGNAGEAGAAIYAASGEYTTTINKSADFVIAGNYAQLYDNYVYFYVDDVFTSVASLDASDGMFDLDNAPLDYEECPGYFADADCTKYIEDGDTIYDQSNVQSATVNNFETVRLYTKTATFDKLTFTLNGNAYSVSKLGAPTGEIVIPRQHDGTNITTIDAHAFDGRYIDSVIIPNSVTLISNWAFSTTKLKKVFIPSSVTTIGSNAFGYCYDLKSVIIDEDANIHRIDVQAFTYCTSLTEVFLPRNIASIGGGASRFYPFYGCTTNLKFYCASSSQPSTWGSGWNYVEEGIMCETFFNSQNINGILIPGDTVMIGDVTDGTQMHFIYHGSYPQTYVGSAMNETLENWFTNNNPVSVASYQVGNASNTNKRTWYAYNYINGYVYARGESYVYDNNYKYANGHSINETGQIAWFKIEPIKWAILNYDEVIAGTAEAMDLISIKALTANIQFNISGAGNTWGESQLETWLNQDFYNSAFDSEDMTKISTKVLKNNVTGDINGSGGMTCNKVYIEGKFDVEFLSLSSESRKCGLTDFALSNYAYMDDERSCYNWLRSAGENDDCVVFLNLDGTFGNTNYSSAFLGIRPAISLQYK